MSKLEDQITDFERLEKEAAEFKQHLDWWAKGLCINSSSPSLYAAANMYSIQEAIYEKLNELYAAKAREDREKKEKEKAK